MSIEIFDGSFAASLWADAHGDALVEAAVTNGAIDWDFNRTAWGIVFEVAFRTDAEWELFKLTDAVRAALHTAPDPHTGVLIYRGRSLDSGTWRPRKPKPRADSGAAALSLPFDTMPFIEPLSALFSDVRVDRRQLARTN